MSGALVSSKQEISAAIQDDGIFIEEESIAKVRKSTSDSSIRDDHGNHKEEDVEEEKEGEGSVNEQMKTNGKVTTDSESNKDSQTTNDRPQVTYQIVVKGDSSPPTVYASNETGDTKRVLTSVTSKDVSQKGGNPGSCNGTNGRNGGIDGRNGGPNGRNGGTNGRNDGINYDAWRNLQLTPSSTKPKDSDAKRFFKKAGGFALRTALISGAVIGGTTLLLPAIGFGALGPIAGSMAAAYQSSVGAVAAGSVFSTLQSVGMVGLSAAAKGGIVAGSAVISGASMSDDKKKKR